MPFPTKYTKPYLNYGENKVFDRPYHDFTKIDFAGNIATGASILGGAITVPADVMYRVDYMFLSVNPTASMGGVTITARAIRYTVNVPVARIFSQVGIITFFGGLDNFIIPEGGAFQVEAFNGTGAVVPGVAFVSITILEHPYA